MIRHPSNVGMVANWNSGLEASCGKYFGKLDDDNRYLPRFLEKTVAALDATPRATYSFTDEWFIQADGRRDLAPADKLSRKYGRMERKTGIQPDSGLLSLQQSPGINSCVFAREKLVAAGGFRTFADEIADFDAFINLAMCGCAAYYVSERLIEYRVHAGQNASTLLMDKKKAQTAIDVLQACRFHGEAETLRHLKLAQAYVSLSRVLLLNQDLESAKHAISTARGLMPNNARALLLAGLLNLPPSMLCYGLRLRYGIDVKCNRQSSAAHPIS